MTYSEVKWSNLLASFTLELLVVSMNVGTILCSCFLCFLNALAPILKSSEATFRHFHFLKTLLFPVIITFGPLETLKGPNANDNKWLESESQYCGSHSRWLACFQVHWRVNVSCDFPDQLFPRSKKPIKNSTLNVSMNVSCDSQDQLFPILKKWIETSTWHLLCQIPLHGWAHNGAYD